MLLFKIPPPPPPPSKTFPSPLPPLPLLPIPPTCPEPNMARRRSVIQPKLPPPRAQTIPQGRRVGGAGANVWEVPRPTNFGLCAPRRAPRPGAPDPPLATNPQESERELIAVTEFNENFKGKLIQVLWPDTGKWYNAEVIKVNVKNRTAKLFYVDAEEKQRAARSQVETTQDTADRLEQMQQRVQERWN